MDDLISRQAAIKALNNWFFNSMDDRSPKQVIEALPSAQPERKKGRWINHRKDRGHHIADCDQCGGTLQWLDPDERPNFCPDCGADMRGEADG